MRDDPKVEALLDALLDSSATPEEVCRSAPDLLPMVRNRWLEVRRAEAQLDVLFPPASQAPTFPEQQSDLSELPSIPGYEIEGLLGTGGMGVVFRACHLKLNRVVALKMALGGAYANPEERARFQREAEAVAALRHPNIVQVYDVGEAQGRPFFTMELIDGGTLTERLAGTPLPARQAAETLALLANAVRAAHEGGVIHRDLKPDNILLSADGVPKLTDFGLARRLDAGAGLTRTGAVIGTPSYMAPEQARGDKRELGPAVDIYALGAILYELLTGRPPFRAESATETVLQVLTQDPVPPSRLNCKTPRDLETICLKCLQKDPSQRYATAADLAAELARFLNGESIHARPASKPELAARWVRRHKGVSAALASIVAILIVVAIGSLWAAAHFRLLEKDQRKLAKEKGDLATETESARLAAVAAEGREASLRKEAEKQGQEFRYNLYLAQMNLAGQAAGSPTGIGRVGERLDAWIHSRPDLRGWEWYYLKGLCHRDRATLHGHSGSVHDAVWSPDSKLIATTGAEWITCIWDASSARLVTYLLGHRHLVAGAAWSPDGKRLATASWDSTVIVWDVARSKEIFTLRGHAGSVQCVAWSKDGKRIATGGNDRSIRIWNADSGTQLGVFRGHEDVVASVSWHPEGRRLASSGRDGLVKIWDADAAKEERTLRGHLNWVNRVAWSPDGTKLATASNDPAAKIWDAGTGRDLFTFRGHALSVQSIAWYPDGSRLVTASDDQTVKIWNASGGAVLVTLRGHTAPASAVQWNYDGSKLLSASFDTTAKIWDGDPLLETITLDTQHGRIDSIAFSRGPKPQFATSGEDGKIRIWDLQKRLTRLVFPAHDSGVRYFAWNPDGTRLAALGGDGSVRVFDALSGKEYASIRISAGGVNVVAWSPEGRYLATGGKDGVIRLWDADSGVGVHVLHGHKQMVFHLAWSPDGKTLASGSADRTVMLWDMGNGRELRTFSAYHGEVTCVAWHPDGGYLATGSNDEYIRIVEAATGKVAQTMRGHSYRINALAWSPDGKRLASMANDRTLKLWDAFAGQETLTFQGQTVPGDSVAWSPDGFQILSAWQDGSVLVHDAAAGYLTSRSPTYAPMVDHRLEANPKDPAALKLRAEILALRGDWDAAGQDLSAWLNSHPHEPWVPHGYWIAGPYSNDAKASHEPEQYAKPEHAPKPEPGGKAWGIWRPLPGRPREFLNFGPLMHHAENISAYALLRVYSRRDQGAVLLVGSDDQVRIWVNADQVHEALHIRRAVPDTSAVRIRFRAGWNTILARVGNDLRHHSLYLRLGELPSSN